MHHNSLEYKMYTGTIHDMNFYPVLGTSEATFFNSKLMSVYSLFITNYLCVQLDILLIVVLE